MNLCKRCNADIPEGYELCGRKACLIPYIYNSAEEWVPIESGQIPTIKDESYWCTVQGKGPENKGRYNDICYFTNEGEFEEPLGFKIIAWRNLPEPYKGE